MILVNTDYISGKNLEMLGLVKGSTIQSKNIGRDITQSFKTIVGGELGAYTEMMNDARALATKRMVAEAEAMGADAIVNIRYASAAVMQGAAEVMAYGTPYKGSREAMNVSIGNYVIGSGSEANGISALQIVLISVFSGIILISAAVSAVLLVIKKKKK